MYSFRTLNEKGFPLLGPQYPEYKGGLQKLINYIRQNLTYPEKAVENNIEGTVEIAFTIMPDGTPSDFKIKKGIGYGCDEAVIALLKKTANWHPGIDDGRPFSIHETISVKFALTDN